MKNETKEKLDALYQAISNSKMLAEEKINAYNLIAQEMSDYNKIERLEKEEFKLIPGCSRYFVSNKGRVLRITSDGEKLCALTPSRNKTNKKYLDVILRTDKNEKLRARLSRVMAKVFLDETLPLLSYRGTKIVVNHKDNNSLNNDLSNIEIVSQKENIREALRLGRQVGKPQRKCFAIKDGVTRNYNSTADLVYDLTGTRNCGYFHHAVLNNHNIKGWAVGFIEEGK